MTTKTDDFWLFFFFLDSMLQFFFFFFKILVQNLFGIKILRVFLILLESVPIFFLRGIATVHYASVGPTLSKREKRKRHGTALQTSLFT